MGKVLIKLISVADQESFTQRLNDFLASVEELDLTVTDLKFSTTADDKGRVVYSALIRYQEGKEAGTANW
jgi:hypothetical protein